MLWAWAKLDFITPAMGILLKRLSDTVVVFEVLLHVHLPLQGLHTFSDRRGEGQVFETCSQSATMQVRPGPLLLLVQVIGAIEHA